MVFVIFYNLFLLDVNGFLDKIFSLLNLSFNVCSIIRYGKVFCRLLYM